MKIEESLYNFQFQKKIQILENAVSQLIDMQSMLHLEVEVLKKKLENVSSENSNSNENDADTENQVGSDNYDLDIAQVQKILKNNNDTSSSTFGRRV